MRPSPTRARAKITPTGAKIALGVGVLLHLVFLVSLPTGFLNPLFVEAAQGYGQASDFFGIYQAGANLARGHSIYDSEAYLNEAPRVVPYFYFYRYLPPTAYGAALFALALPPWPAYWVWVALNEILIALVVLSLLRWKRWDRDRRIVMAALWLGFTPFYIEQVMGQFSLIMAVFLWVLWRWERGAAPGDTGAPSAWWHVLSRWKKYRWREDRAGQRGVVLAWAASLSLKSFSVFLTLPYLRDRMLKRVLAGGLIAGAVSLPYFLFRPADLWEFARLNFSPFTPRLYKGAFGMQTALRDLVSHLPDSWTTPAVHLLGRSFDLERAVLLGASVLVLALAAHATLRAHDLAERRALDLGLWIAVFFLVFKSVWEYHYVMMLPAVTALYLVSGSRTVLLLGIWMGLPTLFACGPLLAGVDPLSDLSMWPAWYRGLHFGVKAVPAVWLFIWCLRAVRSPAFARAG